MKKKKYKNPCGCGCGLNAKKGNTFINGHNLRLIDFKTCRNYEGKNNPFFGKTHTEETKKKMRENHQDYSGENHPRYGKPVSQEQRDKISNNKERSRKISLALTGVKKSKKHNRKVSRTRIQKELSKGENNPNWKGGISFLPYCKKFNNQLKRAVRKRDHYTCQRCGKRQKKHGRRLTVHHIHFDKKNCFPDLITLCTGCNTIVNYKRKSSEKRFMKNLKERNLLNWNLNNENKK